MSFFSTWDGKLRQAVITTSTDWALWDDSLSKIPIWLVGFAQMVFDKSANSLKIVSCIPYWLRVLIHNCTIKCKAWPIQSGHYFAALFLRKRKWMTLSQAQLLAGLMNGYIHTRCLMHFILDKWHLWRQLQSGKSGRFLLCSYLCTFLLISRNSAVRQDLVLARIEIETETDLPIFRHTTTLPPR